MRPQLMPLALAIGLLAPPAGGAGQIAVDPKGVNVNAQAATTVLLTFGGLREQVPAEAFWCGALIDAAPDLGTRCEPATIYGRLPLRYDLSRTIGSSFTDVMSVPASVARRAYQAAQSGEDAPFFYVRRFVSTRGGPDEYVAVTCRLTSGGARVPLSLTEVTVAFDIEAPLMRIAAGRTPPPISARIRYTGTGRLVGRWEVVLPGEDLPSRRDLLTEASLPPEERGTQKRYTELGRFNVFLPPGGGITLDGPNVDRLPTAVEGTYLVLLRIEASDDRETDSNSGVGGGAGGIVHAGGIAGFPMPVLRYVVGSAGDDVSPARTGAIELYEPAEGGRAEPGRAIAFAWSPVARAVLYRLEVQSDSGDAVFSALVTDSARYRSPPWLADRGHAVLRWRVTALGSTGGPLARTEWRRLAVVRP